LRIGAGVRGISASARGAAVARPASARARAALSVARNTTTATCGETGTERATKSRHAEMSKVTIHDDRLSNKVNIRNYDFVALSSRNES
jgi:hypothetical protein